MRVGIIGAGLQGRRRAQALKKSGDELVIVDAAQENGVKLKCGFNHRHHPGIKKAGEWFGHGIIGS